MNLKEAETRIVQDPQICSGDPTIKGTRIRVTHLVGMVKAEGSVEAVLNDFDWITRKDVEAAHVWLEANPQASRE